MATKIGVCVAVAASVAGALSITGTSEEQRRTLAFLSKADVTVKWPMETDLPRTVLHTSDADFSGCGKEVPGYFTIQSLQWESSWPVKATNTTECAEKCDNLQECVGFSSRQPTGDKKLQCNLYRGLHQKLHRGMSFVRCVPGFECQKGLPGFKFSHVGTWRDGNQIKALDDESVEDCAMACQRNRSCVAMTYFEGHDDDKYCFHFNNENNQPGPRRDMRAFSYSKCTLDAAKVPEEGVRFLKALASKKDGPKDEQSEDAPPLDAAPAKPLGRKERLMLKKKAVAEFRAMKKAEREAKAAGAAAAAEEAKPQATACSFDGPHIGYLYDCVDGDDCHDHGSQAAAEAACIAAGTACGGLTADPALGNWQMRQQSTPQGSTSESSYVKVCQDSKKDEPTGLKAEPKDEQSDAPAAAELTTSGAPAAEEAAPEDDASPPDAAPAEASDLGVGAAVVVVSKSGAERKSTVVEAKGDEVKIHFNGFEPKHDEWMSRLSSRIKEVKAVAAEAP